MSEIDKSKALEIAADKLKHALSAIVPKKKKRAKGNYPLTLYSTSEGKFVFADSMYESSGIGNRLQRRLVGINRG